MKLEAENQVAIERLQLVELQNTRGQHSDDHYRDANREKISVIKVPDTQQLQYCDYISSTLRGLYCLSTSQ